MQDIGGKEDTELSKENLILCWREFSVESLDAVSLLEIGCFFPRGFNSSSSAARPASWKACQMVARRGTRN